MFSTSTILDAFYKFAPETLMSVRIAYEDAKRDLSFTRLAIEPWTDLKDISIDYAIMERATNMSVMPYGGSWSDLGDWQAVWREGNAESDGVVVSGSTTFIIKNTLLRATSNNQEVVAIGLEDLVVVAMPDACWWRTKIAHKMSKPLFNYLRQRAFHKQKSCLGTTGPRLV